MTPCIAQITTLSSSFADDLENCVAAGCRSLEVWLAKLELHLEAVSAADTIRSICDRGLSLPAAAYQGGLMLAEAERRALHNEHFKRRLDLCQSFGIATLIVAADSAPHIQPSDLGRATESLSRAARWAAGFGVRIALEFRAESICTNLATALALVGECGETNLGICFDLFHYYKGPSKPEDLTKMAATNLFHVQLCDVAGIPREIMTDADRIMPGDGEFVFAPIISHLRAIDYGGAVSLELMNPVLWRLNPKQVVEIGSTALERVMGSR